MKKYAEGGTSKVAPKDRMPAPQSDEELDQISPAALQEMIRKRRDAKQEKKQTKMEKEVRGNKKGGSVKMAKGGSVSKRADGCATKGKTRGRFV